MTTSEYGNKFIRYLKAKNRSESTIKTYRSIVLKFLKHYKVNPSKITSKMVYDYALSIQTPRTRNQTIGCLKTFFTHGCGMPRVVTVPYAKIGRKLPKYITKQDFDKGLSKITFKKHRLIALLLYGCGLRIGELINLKTENVREAVSNDGLFYYLEIKDGKGDKDRNIPLPESIHALIDFDKEYVIDNRGRYSESSARKVIQHYFDTNPHSLRHGFATELVNKDKNLKKISVLLGHESTKTTEIYSHTSVASLLDCCVL